MYDDLSGDGCVSFDFVKARAVALDASQFFSQCLNRFMLHVLICSLKCQNRISGVSFGVLGLPSGCWLGATRKRANTING